MSVPVFIDSSSFEHAAAYYDATRTEGTAVGGDETIGRVYSLPNGPQGKTFTALLEKIVAHTPADATGGSII